MTRRVVVTAMGMISPLGNTVETSWEAIKAGRSGVGPITHFDTANYLVKIAAEVRDFDPTDYMDKKEIRRRDPYQHYATAASLQALEAAGLTEDDSLTSEERRRMSVVIGSAIGGMQTYAEYIEVINTTGNPRKVTPFGITMAIPDGASNIVSVMAGAGGPSCVPVSACATGADCIGYAFDLIKAGRIDRALAGAAEYPVIPMGVAVFDRAGACSREQIRPFDKRRDGFVFGDGCGVILLEELEAAKRRGATILAELVGYGCSSDAIHITAPDPYGMGASEAIELALQDAELKPEDVDYINAHGTGTELNDKMETNAVKRVFGEYAYQVPMSSTKSMTGHAMGATAAMEAIFSVLSIRDNVAPPTINLEEADPECDLDYVPHTAREHPIDVVMSNSFGFGGHNSVLVFKRYHD